MILKRMKRSFMAMVTQNLVLLMILRWITIIGNLVVLTMAIKLFHIIVPLSLILSAIGLLIFFNTAVYFLSRVSPIRNASSFIFFQLVVDIMTLTYILFCTGGMTNPFTGLYLIYIVLSAILLPKKYCWLSVVITMGSYVMISIYHIPISHSHHHDAINLHYYGMIFSYAISAILVAFFGVKMADNNRDQYQMIQQMNNQIKENMMVSEFGLIAANAAHELGTPLSSIALYIDDMIQDKLDQDKLDKDDRFIKIKRNIQRCKQILQETLNSFRSIPSHLQNKSDITSFLDQLTQKCYQYYPIVKFEIQNNNNQDHQISSPKLVEQAVVSIIENAVTASPNHVDVCIFCRNNQLYFNIQDKGCGILPEVINNIDKWDTDNLPNNKGFGLKLAHQVITKMNGKLSIKYDSGTRVSISVPIQKRDTE